ncbi:hypothetical protein ACIPW5_04750 [Streptomyces sp. NPDC090077]|uniref:hypothetical protein n=1 Tax=Streptomyces sp. NPDC090077 TaxID=3365938 RepID=UPI00382017C5
MSRTLTAYTAAEEMVLVVRTAAFQPSRSDPPTVMAAAPSPLDRRAGRMPSALRYRNAAGKQTEEAGFSTQEKAIARLTTVYQIIDWLRVARAPHTAYLVHVEETGSTTSWAGRPSYPIPGRPS